MKVAIVGASGFVGISFLQAYLDKYELSALSRSKPRVESSAYQWHRCDLHNLLDIEKGLEGCDVAIYLVHSMLASAGLNQGRFQDFDVSLADNLGRAALTAGVKKLIYLSGLIPDDNLSTHLKSRLEVETVLAHYFPDITILRAGIILGSEGSSFNMMYRLAKHLPLMICPRWTNTLSQTIYIDDIVTALDFCLQNPSSQKRIYDLGSEPALPYKSMMQKIGRRCGREPKIFLVRMLFPQMSGLWVTLITGAPLELTKPLVGSLKSPMLVHPERALTIPGYSFKSFEESIDLIFKKKNLDTHNPPHAFVSWLNKQRNASVRSIQRITVPNGWSAKNIADAYMSWLPTALRYLIGVDVSGEIVSFYLLNKKFVILRLKYSPERSSKDRQLFYLVGGALFHSSNEKARLEFRKLPHESSLLAAIHDYVPALPWPIYRSTQAIFHARVMDKFEHYLRKVNR